MSKKARLKQAIYLACKHNRHGSFETQRQRKQILLQIADELHMNGFKITHMQGLRQKHIVHLNTQWKAKGLSNGTIKNRNASLRWACELMGKKNMVPSNKELGIGTREKNVNRSKALQLDQINWGKITNKRIYIQLHLQRHLGLRRKESCMFKPYLADRGDYVYLSKSWCKGGRDRFVPIVSKEARYWIEEAKKLVVHRGAAMIPPDKSYIEHRNLYDDQVRRAGITKGHGLRHAFAQERYRELTGWDCPARGGPKRKELTKEQKVVDREMRMRISEMIGHSRISVVAEYCGQ